MKHLVSVQSQISRVFGSKEISEREILIRTRRLVTISEVTSYILKFKTLLSGVTKFGNRFLK